MTPKFRAWDKHSQKMFANDELIIWNNNVYANDSKKLTCNNLKGWSIDDEYLMQSTGLKDKNGKEIFEGDIVRMRNPRDRRQIGMFQVVRVANSPMLGLLDKELTTEIFNLYEHMRNYYEVKGNIYENPELLEDLT